MSEPASLRAALPQAAQHLAPDLEVERLKRLLLERRFLDVALALRTVLPATVTAWRTLSIAAMPDLDRFTIDEFESGFTVVLAGMSVVFSGHDASGIGDLLDKASELGSARAGQDFSPQMLLAEERILRSVLTAELRREMGRALVGEEAAAFHLLLDLIGERSLLALIAKRADARDRALQLKVSGMHRLADVGTLVAGVAHDASNLLLPLRMRLEHLERADLPPDVREDVLAMSLIVRQFQNSVVNLRWLSVDPMALSQGAIAGGEGERGGRAVRPPATLNLARWGEEVLLFHRRMVPSWVEIAFDLPAELPEVAISSAALSQAVFNLIHNAVQAFGTQPAAGEGKGAENRARIFVHAHTCADRAGVELIVEDNGPGMTPEALSRCMEPFFTTAKGGSGLGLSLVDALVTGSGGELAVLSPVPGKDHGVAVILKLPLATSKTEPQP